MDDPELSRKEQMILDVIEQDLRSDARLDRRLRTLRRGGVPWSGSWGRALHHHLGVSTACLGIACAVLFVQAVASTPSPAALWSFAAVWVPTGVCLIRLLQRRRHKKTTLTHGP